MNVSLRVLASSVVILSLSACASTQRTVSTYSPAYPETRLVQDVDYIQNYERAAQRRAFVHVHWVNPPTRRVTAEN
ncbi:hypothetical protein H0E84_18070 [Luteimonas sp. SJ-92]|uniref:Lipoprotein n=1 Tax=Luteimonas salinisoli TaxID=2752307 RepID=A0A853JHD3_9GAMM|nr:hypothetical protein [Luteimonas salinisoli]NZA28285.1 hypothetical protein [Luteimonas salinisoli]